MMKSMFMLYLSLALGYVLCVVANKQTGILKTLGYTIGIAMLVLSLVSGVMVSAMLECPMAKKMCGTGGMGGMMMNSGMCHKTK